MMNGHRKFPILSKLIKMEMPMSNVVFPLMKILLYQTRTHISLVIQT